MQVMDIMKTKVVFIMSLLSINEVGRNDKGKRIARQGVTCLLINFCIKTFKLFAIQAFAPLEFVDFCLAKVILLLLFRIAKSF